MKTQEWLKQHSQIENFRLVEKEKSVVVKLPKTTEKKKSFWFYESKNNQTVNEIFCAEVPQLRVSCLNNGIAGTSALTNDNCELDDIFTYAKESLGGAKKAKEIIRGKSAFISQKWGGSNYCHWLLTAMPRLGVLKEAGMLGEIDNIFINSYQLSCIKQAYELLGLKKQVIPFTVKPSVIAEKAIITSNVGQGDKGRVLAGAMTKRYITSLFGKYFKSQQKGKRLYINRSKSRVINNMDQCSKLLKRFGFEEIKCENLSFLEQIQIFSSAEAVVGSHGAGISNYIFCHPGTKVLEILSPQYIGSGYWTMSASSELDYWYLLGEGEYAKTKSDERLTYKNNTSCIEVDLKDLEEILTKMGL